MRNDKYIVNPKNYYKLGENQSSTVKSFSQTKSNPAPDFIAWDIRVWIVDSNGTEYMNLQIRLEMLIYLEPLQDSGYRMQIGVALLIMTQILLTLS